MKKYLFPKLGDILFISLLTVILLLGPRTFNLDGDLGRHITVGNYILDNYTIPRTDVFSHTMFGQPLTPHEWLAQVFFALSQRALSLAGTVLLTAVIVAFSFLLVFRDSVHRNSMTFASLVISLLAAAASSLHWLARPHVFTFLYLAIWILLLERVRTETKTSFWILGFVMLLWANTHGAFIAGFVSWGAYMGGEILEGWKQKELNFDKLKRWVLIGAVSFAVTFINPAGIHLWGTSFGFVGNRYLVSHTQEYLPPDFHNQGTWPFLLMIALVIFVTSIKKNRLPYSHSLLLTGWAAMGLYSARNIPLFAIVAAPILSTTVAGLLSGLKRWNQVEINILKIEQSLRSGAWIAGSILLAMIFVSTPITQAYNIFDATVFPVKSVDWLDEHPQDGKVFNHFPWGGYLLYREWPDTLVFIDGQTDFYGEALTREYEQVITLDGNWDDVLDKYKVGWVLIPVNSTLTEALKQEGWDILYEDQTATVLRK